ncbi:hypothetical protein [Aliarcobacter lanthieri]|uniref:hypothetical protein n=1 Tax=Aliarcobacter lanthieri TaxID=1355374 RepID=UPI00047B9CA7|nr:hypothetical protein [Aliarcobacter lanthieri]
MTNKTNISNEKEIREAFKILLKKSFSNGFTFDEFSGGSLRTRPDLATFLPNKILFTEIKSNRDTFDRLDGQIFDYSKIASRVFVVLDEKHLKKFQAKYKHRMYFCEFIFFKDGEFYYPEYEMNDLKRKIEIIEICYSQYPNYNINILSLLWKKEREYFTGFLKGRTKIIDERLVIEQLYTAKEISDISYSILYDRAKNRADSESGKLLTYNHGWYDKEILHKEHKQFLFDNIECEYSLLKRIVKKEPTKKPKNGQQLIESFVQNSKVTNV